MQHNAHSLRLERKATRRWRTLSKRMPVATGRIIVGRRSPQCLLVVPSHPLSSARPGGRHCGRRPPAVLPNFVIVNLAISQTRDPRWGTVPANSNRSGGSVGFLDYSVWNRTSIFIFDRSSVVAPKFSNMILREGVFCFLSLGARPLFPPSPMLTIVG